MEYRPPITPEQPRACAAVILGFRVSGRVGRVERAENATRSSFSNALCMAVGHSFNPDYPRPGRFKKVGPYSTSFASVAEARTIHHVVFICPLFSERLDIEPRKKTTLPLVRKTRRRKPSSVPRGCPCRTRSPWLPGIPNVDRFFWNDNIT